MTTIGIDPGATGAIAIYSPGSPDRINVLDMPTVEIKRGKRMVHEVNAGYLAIEISLNLNRAERVQAFIEKVHAAPGQGVSSMFAFGRARGVVEGVLAALEIPITYVSPNIWVRSMNVVGGKDGSRKRAGELFPSQAELFRRKMDDGRADAALIAMWGARQRGADLI